MGFLNFYLKLKAFRFRRLLNKGSDEEGEKRNFMVNGKRTISHGDESIVETWSFGAKPVDHDIMVSKREEIQGNEFWVFGIFEPRIGDEISNSIETHLFNHKSQQWHLRKKSKEILRKAHLNCRAKLREEETDHMSSATAIVINREKLVVANMGEYKAILCRNGKAHHIKEKKQGRGLTRQWSRQFIPSSFLIKPSKTTTNIVVESHGIDSQTEFIILGNVGIWEVMKYQEAVGLIRHIEDPQEAAECLAKEALARMSKNIISCLVIRFD
ncbi:OLC1v1019671C2 [Oldenlandia corymbosa var. corymbosa]|uniref:OLC1v1019671C2 n=1 Tax=Oldenlandia corymbosa var. corymbosa TaxID=529605 RepID=A0AAV1EEG5_OLDCO|nr:OLC1v1019671C2 [Oldenlandia corymbosa var. corymbosa]